MRECVNLCSISMLGFFVAVAFPISARADIMDPSEISGLVLNLDVRTLNLSDGAAVTTWQDSTGLGNRDASQGNGAFQPTFRLNGIAPGRNAVEFNGSQFLRIPEGGAGVLGRDLGAADKASVFVVLKQDSGGVNGALLGSDAPMGGTGRGSC